MRAHVFVRGALLADAEAHREAAGAALALLDGDGPASEAVAAALGHLADRAPFAGLADRLAGLGTDLADLSGALRNLAETVEEDPARLDELGERRRLLAELRRKYGTSLGEVMDYHPDLESGRVTSCTRIGVVPSKILVCVLVGSEGALLGVVFGDWVLGGVLLGGVGWLLYDLWANRGRRYTRGEMTLAGMGMNALGFLSMAYVWWAQTLR